jgi:uncharacterized protein
VTSAVHATDDQRAARTAGVLLATRLGLVALATFAAWALVAAGDGAASFPPTPMLASLSLLPVNVVCLVLTSRFLRAEGRTLRSLFAPHGGWAREIG